ncbi:MAG: helix-turn-helix domain-containing protein [Planctomycetota bacterium]
MSIGLKLYYLRSRVKKTTQTIMSKDLKIRQATISNIEQDLSLPSVPLLKTLCQYFDVTPTFLLDDEGPLQPRETDRWSTRHGRVSVGQYLEVPENAIHKLEDSYLVAMLPGTTVYDEEAARSRASGSEQSQLEQANALEMARRKQEEIALRRELQVERQTSRLRRRGVPGSKLEKMLSLD